MRDFLKKEAERYANLTHQQWGWVTGMILGLALGTYVVAKYGLVAINWQIEGKIESDNKIFNFIVEASIIPLTAGLFANLFSNMGAGIDIITNKNTLLSLALKKYRSINQQKAASNNSIANNYGTFFSIPKDGAPVIVDTNEAKSNKEGTDSILLRSNIN